LKSNRRKKKSVIVDLKIPSLLIIDPSQGEVRNGTSFLFLPAFKPIAGFARNGPPCGPKFLLGSTTVAAIHAKAQPKCVTLSQSFEAPH
jgi:hypothetical protein